MILVYDAQRTKTVNDSATILLVEDREEDVILIQKAFERGKIPNPLQVVRNGEDAINYLAGIGRFSDRLRYPFPLLVLLDLKMPAVDGFEVLRWIKSQQTLGPLRVVVLTSSENIRDVSLAYQLGATSFLVKPLDFNHTVAMTETIMDYWLGINVPSGPRHAGPVDENRQKNGSDSAPTTSP
jgi:CheY-like chemotaxis protein